MRAFERPCGRKIFTLRTDPYIMLSFLPRLFLLVFSVSLVILNTALVSFFIGIQALLKLLIPIAMDKIIVLVLLLFILQVWLQIYI